MANRPFVDFQEVKRVVSIPDVLEAFGIADRFRQKGDSLVGVCPIHQHGPSPNPDQFRIDRKGNTWLWHCFGDCQRGGDVVELIKALSGYDDAHCRLWIAERFGERLTLTRPRKRDQAHDRDVIRDTPNKETSGSESTATVATADLKPLRFRLNLDPGVPYLVERGLTPETIARFGLGLAGKGMLKGYVAFPVYGLDQAADENPVAYLGRYPGDPPAGQPRYKWPKGFEKTRVVYPRESLAATTSERLVVVEGPFPALRLCQAGFGAVCIFGSDLSEEQADILVATGRPIWLLFDGDEAGRAGMRTAAGKLITRASVRVIKLPDDTQPDDLSLDQLGELLG